MIFKILICFIAGIGAGLGTGFAGMSAAAVISPMLITFLGLPAYEAVGIALASDVLASAVSAYTYGKSGNLDIRNGLVMMAAVLTFTLVGSWAASLVPNTTMGNFSVVMTFFLGIKFIVKPIMATREAREGVSREKQIIQSIISGVGVGFICGFVGAGGGMMMLLLLTSVLGYELKTAVGTSVFIMTFTAFTGAVSHMVIGGLPDLGCLFFCVLFNQGQPLIQVMPYGAEADLHGGMLAGNGCSGWDGLRIFVTGNEERLLLSAQFDNLGKGASGAAIQCLNLMLGCEEEKGLNL